MAGSSGDRCGAAFGPGRCCPSCGAAAIEVHEVGVAPGSGDGDPPSDAVGVGRRAAAVVAAVAALAVVLGALVAPAGDRASGDAATSTTSVGPARAPRPASGAPRSFFAGGPLFPGLRLGARVVAVTEAGDVYRVDPDNGGGVVRSAAGVFRGRALGAVVVTGGTVVLGGAGQAAFVPNAPGRPPAAVDGRSLERVGLGPPDPVVPAPTGALVARPGPTRIEIVGPDERSVARLATAGVRGAPSWSPDGRVLVWVDGVGRLNAWAGTDPLVDLDSALPDVVAATVVPDR